jgi:hypothetical protein
MEDWWDRNKHHFHRYDINVAGHACITAANKLNQRHQQLYENSTCHLVRDLVIQYTRGASTREAKHGMGGLCRTCGS